MGTVPKDGDAHSILSACTGDKSLHKASVALDENDVSWLPHFREWNQIIYKIDLSTCDNVPHGLRKATL